MEQIKEDIIQLLSRIQDIKTLDLIKRFITRITKE